MLKLQHIQLDKGLARRLLRRAPGIVYNATLYGFVIWCIGCVIPTPLDRAPGNMNYAVVADRPFTGNTPRADGGLTDSNHWEVTCTSM
jgi:hypothetical protein